MIKLLFVDTWNFLKGRKTFITGFVMIALGLLTDDTTLILEGIGLMTLRHAIATK